MNELPSYFEELSTIVPEHILPLFIKVEGYLDTLNYTAHMDRLDESVLKGESLGNSGVFKLCMDDYRVAVDDVLQLQGIRLIDVIGIEFYKLERLLYAVVEIGTKRLYELLIDEDITYDSDFEYFAMVLSSVMQVDASEIGLYIEYVHPSTIKAIRKDIDFVELETMIIEETRERFLSKVPAESRNGPVGAFIRASGSFGYDLRRVAYNVAAEIVELQDKTLIANEILALGYGSNVPTSVLSLELSEVTELIIDDTGLLLSVNSLISKSLSK